jgi:phenylalanyl-tRNA synthetase beta subunit
MRTCFSWLITVTLPKKKGSIFCPEEVEKTLGYSIEKEEMIKILTGLGFEVNSIREKKQFRLQFPAGEVIFISCGHCRRNRPNIRL